MEAIPPGTNNQTKRHTEMFRNFLSSKGLSKNFEKAPSKILCDYLRLFYANARTKTGELYAPSSLIYNNNNNNNNNRIFGQTIENLNK